MRRGKQEEAKGGAPAWMMTYGDIMTLLLTFFVLLLSFSSIQEAKFKETIGALQDALGVMKFPETTPIEKSSRASKMIQIQEKAPNAEMEKVINLLKEAGLEGSFDVFPTKEGFAVRLSSPLLFDLGSARLKDEAKEILSGLTEILSSFDNNLKIEGHTCDIPINTPEFPSNWELSTARALSVLKFINGHGIVPERLSAVGYGEFKPLLPNDSFENRHANRRVEIYVNFRALERPSLRQFFLEEAFDG